MIILIIMIMYLYFEGNEADYYDFVSKHTRIEHENYSRGRTHARTRTRTRQIKRKK
jgi:hypothetical protein